jgi:chromosome segregation ATPase
MSDKQSTIKRFLLPKQSPTFSRKTKPKRQRSLPEVEESNKKQQIKTKSMDEKIPAGNMSLSQLMEAIGLMMDRKLADVAKVEDLKELGEKLEKLKEENESLKAEIRTIKAEYSTVKEQLEELDNYNKFNF